MGKETKNKALAEDDLKKLINDFMIDRNTKAASGKKQEPQTSEDYVNFAYDADDEMEGKIFTKSHICETDKLENDENEYSLPARNQ